MTNFKSLLEFQKHFDTDEKCREYLELTRWNNTPACAFCGSVNVKRLKDGKRFQCNEKECRKQFSVTVGTVFENTKVPLTKFFLAMYVIGNHSKGISSLQLASYLNVTQRTAWFIAHRVRAMLTDKAPEKLDSTVEIDETYWGGKEKNKHGKIRLERFRRIEDNNRLRLLYGKAQIDNKTPIVGALQRGGLIKLRKVENTQAKNLIPFMVDSVKKGSLIITDEHRGYATLKVNGYKHELINHSNREYVRGEVHTNNIEGFWGILKRGLHGIHHQVSPKHLQRYCDEYAFRYNLRGIAQDERFASALKGSNGRLKYKDLIAKTK